MRKTIYVKAAILSAVGVLGFSSTGMAQWWTLDFSAIQPTVQNVQQEAQSVKQQIESCKELQTIKSAVGDAKEAASKFNEDVVQKAKAEAEKVKKEAEKAKKVQEDIKKAKEEYEKQKKEYEEYKSKLDEAKSMASEAKEVASGATALASQSISDVQAKAGISNNNTLGGVAAANGLSSVSGASVKNTAEVSSAQKNTSVNKATLSAAVNTGAVSVQAAGTVGRVANISDSSISRADGTIASPVNRGTVSAAVGAAGNAGRVSSVSGNNLSRAGGAETSAVNMRATGAQTFSSVGQVSQVAGVNETEKVMDPEIAEEINEIKRVATEEGSSTATRLLKLSIDDAIKNKDVERLDAFSSIDTADIINSDSKKYEEEPKVGGRRAFSNPGEQQTVEGLKAQALEAKEKLSPVTQKEGLSVVPNAKEMSATKSNVSKELTGATPSVLSPAKEAPAVKNSVSSSIGGTISNAMSNTKEVSAVKSDASKSLGSVASSVAPATKSISSVTSAAPVAKSVAPVNNSISNSISGGVNKVNSFTQPTTTAPMKALQKNSFWLNEKKTAQHNTKLSFADTLKFASTTGDCSDYNNVIQTKKGTVIIIPNLMAKECCLKFEAGSLPDLKLIRDCAKKLVRESKGLLEINAESLEECNAEGLYDDSLGECVSRTDTALGQEALGTYNAIVAEQGTNSAAEGMIDKIKANEYVKTYFEPYKEKVAEIQSSAGGESGSSNKDATSLLTLTNQQMMYLLNMIRRNYTASLEDMSLRGLGGVSENAVKDEERGVDSTNEYVNTVVRQEDKAVVEYPVLPENIAVKCNINVKEVGENSSDEITENNTSVTALADCFRQIVKDINVSNETEIENAQDFLQFTQYQEVLNTLEKAVYQKVKSSNYEETLDESEKKNNDSTTARKGNDALFSTETEIARILDDLVNVYASRLTYTAIKGLSKLETPTVSSSAATEG